MILKEEEFSKRDVVENVLHSDLKVCATNRIFNEIHHLQKNQSGDEVF